MIALEIAIGLFLLIAAAGVIVAFALNRTIDPDTTSTPTEGEDEA